MLQELAMVTQVNSVFADVPFWFILIGLAVSLYHGYRGYILQRVTVQHQKSEAKKNAAQETETEPNWFWSDTETVVVRYIYDALFYFFCSVIGFVALWAATKVFDALPSVHNVSGGTGALLVFLVILALLGISGQLPQLIQHGKLPK